MMWVASLYLVPINTQHMHDDCAVQVSKQWWPEEDNIIKVLTTSPPG